MANDTAFPHCCGVRLIYGVQSNRFSDTPVYKSELITSEFLEGAKKNLTKFGYAFMVVTTNDQQADANEVLEEFGFKHTGWVKGNHPTRIAIWWYALNPEFKNATGDELVGDV